MEDAWVSFDEVMLDWAVAELLSPTWPTNWAGPARHELKRKLQDAGIGGLRRDERIWLVEAIIRCRSPIISVYGPSRSWSFQQIVVSSEELSAFSIIHHYGYPNFSLGDLAVKIKGHPSDEERNTCDIVSAILTQAAAGKPPIGLPIAVKREITAPPLLIEGYKRAMAALWSGHPAAVAIYLCCPGPAP